MSLTLEDSKVSTVDSNIMNVENYHTMDGIIIYDNVVTINVASSTNFYLLRQVLSRMLDEVIIHCNSIYIPSFIFSVIDCSNLYLYNPVLDDEILSSVKCHDVYIEYYGKCMNFKLLDCKVFTMDCLVDTAFPVMPMKACDITLKTRFQSKEVLFEGNENIERLSIKTVGSLVVSIILKDVPSLDLLSVDQNVLVNKDTLLGLTTFQCGNRNVGFGIVPNGYISITKKPTSINIELPNLKVFQGDTDNYRIIMPNLKKLTTSRIPNVEEIPSNLREYHRTSLVKRRDVNKLIELQRYLSDMESIEKMDILVSDRYRITVPEPKRINVYYNIYVQSRDDVEPIDPDEISENLRMELQYVLKCNQNYTNRNASLESLN